MAHSTLQVRLDEVPSSFDKYSIMGDPWYWDVERVIYELSTPGRPWHTGDFYYDDVDLDILARSFLQIHMDGKSLFHFHDNIAQNQSNDFTVGWRRYVHSAVLLLCDLSPEYRCYRSTSSPLGPLSPWSLGGIGHGVNEASNEPPAVLTSPTECEGSNLLANLTALSASINRLGSEVTESTTRWVQTAEDWKQQAEVHSSTTVLDPTINETKKKTIRRVIPTLIVPSSPTFEQPSASDRTSPATTTAATQTMPSDVHKSIMQLVNGAFEDANAVTQTEALEFESSVESRGSRSYPSPLAMEKMSKSHMPKIVRIRNGNPNIKDIEQLLKSISNSSLGLTPEFLDGLEKRALAAASSDDEELPLYGESDDEGDYDTQTLKEMEKEKAEEAKRAETAAEKATRKLLSAVKVSEIIRQQVSYFIGKWFSRQRKKCLHECWKLWHEAQRNNTFHDHIVSNEVIIKHLKAKLLPKFIWEIKSMVWSSERAVRKACSDHLGQTVWNIKRHEYRVSTLQSAEPPEKPPTLPRPKQAAKSTHMLESAKDKGDDADGEGEGSNDSLDDLSDFVVSDDEEELRDSYEGLEDPVTGEDNSKVAELHTYDTSDSNRDALQRFPQTPRASDIQLRVKVRCSESELDSPTSQNTPQKAFYDLTQESFSTRVIDLVTPEKSKDGSPVTPKPPRIILHLTPNNPKSDSDGPQDGTQSRFNISDGDDVPQSAIKRHGKRAFTTQDDDPPLSKEHAKWKKRRLLENVVAMDLQNYENRRLAEVDVRRKIQQMKLAQDGATGPTHGIVVNTSKNDQQGYVYLNSIASPRIQSHQIQGVQFLWDQLVVNHQSNQGCLLAHTMGLGKTMQTITVLVTIAEAAASPDATIRSQIPIRLRISKTLILCPPTLVNNWLDELLCWVPGDVLGEFWKVDSTLKKAQRLAVISRWFDQGGVLVIGYDMFRSMIFHAPSESLQAPPLTENEYDQLKKYLLQGPNIIVADEAHILKNPKAKITSAVLQFRSGSRIALTGSPLSNHIEEYYSMINWVAPNFLGPIEKFRLKYKNPIEEGLYANSEPSQRRRSLRKLETLHQRLSSKVDRADATALRDAVPPKREFIIEVPLTALQFEAYRSYIRCMRSNAPRSKDGGVISTAFLAGISLLQLLCNHPACFIEKLRSFHNALNLRYELESSKNQSDINVESGIDFTKFQSDISMELEFDSTKPHSDIQEYEPQVEQGDSNALPANISENMVTQQTKIFDAIEGDIRAVGLSNKIKLLKIILHASKIVKDKVLVFSRSLPTLRYLESLCKAEGLKSYTLDGSTKIDDRQRNVKTFNSGNADVYLISTNAGGLGLNLHGANRVVVFDFGFNPAIEEQAIARSYRIGQLKPVYVYRFVVGGTFEEDMYNSTIFKTQLARRVIDKKSIVSMAHKNLGDMIKDPTRPEQLDLQAFELMDPHVLDKILALQKQDPCVRSIVQSDSFEVHENDNLTAEEHYQAKKDALEGW